MGGRNAFLEDIGILLGIVGGGFRTIHADEVAKLGEEKLVIGAFGRAGGNPGCRFASVPSWCSVIPKKSKRGLQVFTCNPLDF